MILDDKIYFRINVLLAFQVAILGMITPNLRGITVGWSDKKISARFYYDGEIGDEEFEIASDVEAEINAGFPDYETDFVAERLDFPKKLNPLTRSDWVYRRME